jgi:hypothetical protein
MNIALLSEQAAPLALQGGTDRDGRNVCRAGHAVDVYTCRDDPAATTTASRRCFPLRPTSG